MDIRKFPWKKSQFSLMLRKKIFVHALQYHIQLVLDARHYFKLLKERITVASTEYDRVCSSDQESALIDSRRFWSIRTNAIYYPNSRSPVFCNASWLIGGGSHEHG